MRKRLMKRLLYSIGRRGIFLLFLSMLDVIYAYALAFPTVKVANSEAYLFLSKLLPLDVWSLMWFISGIICFIYAFKMKDSLGYAVAMFIKLTWASLFLVGWLFFGVERGYLSTTIWGAFAGVLGVIATWPDEVKAKNENNE